MSSGPFAGIRGHGPLLDALARAMREDRVASALLFHGPAGVGKLTTALALIRGLLCPVSAPDACGGCDSCRKISPAALLHSDVGLLWPRPRKSAEAGAEEGEEEGEEGAGEPSAVAGMDLHALQEDSRINPRWTILTDQVRARLGELFLSPGGGKRRVLLILAADRLNNTSSNVLLKVLEEPPGGAVIILLCESLSALLPTIRSRCQVCRFSPLPRTEVEEFLREQGAAPAREARLVASLCGGKIGAALLLARDAETYRSRREILTRLVAEIRRGRSAAIAIAAAKEILSEESDTAEDFSILMDILRDTMLAGSGCSGDRLTDARPALAGEDLRLTPLEAATLLPRVERAREDLRRSVNLQVAVETLLLDLGDPSGSPPEWE